MFAVHNTSDLDLKQDGYEVCQPISVLATHRAKCPYMYLAFLTDMPPTLRKIDERKPTSIDTYYILGFQVFMDYSNTVKGLYQFVYVRSAGNHVSSM